MVAWTTTIRRVVSMSVVCEDENKMITIRNISPTGTSCNTVYKYELKINGIHVCTFYHDPRYGLAKCLKDAAKAVNQMVEKEKME